MGKPKRVAIEKLREELMDAGVSVDYSVFDNSGESDRVAQEREKLVSQLEDRGFTRPDALVFAERVSGAGLSDAKMYGGEEWSNLSNSGADSKIERKTSFLQRFFRKSSTEGEF